MMFKKLGALLSLWEAASTRSNKYQLGDRNNRWSGFNIQYFSIGRLFVLAQERNVEMLERVKPTLNKHSDAFADDAVYHDTEIQTPAVRPTSQAP